MADASKTKERPAVSRRIEVYGTPVNKYTPIATVTDYSNSISRIDVEVKGSSILPRSPIITVIVDRGAGVVKLDDRYMGLAEVKLNAGDADSLHESDGILRVLKTLRDGVAELDKRDGKKVVTEYTRGGPAVIPYRFEVGWDTYSLKSIDSAINLLEKR